MEIGPQFAGVILHQGMAGLINMAVSAGRA
jgi:hypothetical protein